MNPVISVYKPLIGEKGQAAMPRGEIFGSLARHLEVVLARRPRTLLDLACCTRPHAVEFAAMGMKVPRVDLNEELLAHGRARTPEIEFQAQVAGQPRTLREHMYRRRLKELVELLEARM
jgi:hypothetical protein